VHRLAREDKQDGGAHVTAAGTRPLSAAERAEARTESASVAVAVRAAAAASATALALPALAAAAAALAAAAEAEARGTGLAEAALSAGAEAVPTALPASFCLRARLRALCVLVSVHVVLLDVR
jgi:hypothetical protein